MSKNISHSLLILGLLLLSSIAFSQNIFSVSVSPAVPMSCTNLSVTVNGDLPCANAAFNGSSHAIVGSTLFVDIDYLIGIICLPAIVPFTQTHNAGMIPAGTYTLTIRLYIDGALVNTNNSNLVVGACCSVNANFTASTTQICAGDPVTFTAADTTLLSYIWKFNGNVFGTGPQVTQAPPNGGTYNIRLITNSGSCVDSTSQSIVVSDPNLSFPQLTDEGCPGKQDGAVDMQVSGGQAPYSYSWSNGATTQDLSQLPGGTYTVSVIDNFGCTDSGSVTLNTGPVVSASFTASADALHCLGDTVSLLSNGSGGSNHSWLSNGQPFAQGQSASIAFPAPGGYSLVLISTNLSCSDTAEMSFTASAPPAVQGSVVQETCPGSADGSVDLTVTGGIPPYNFGWSNGASSEDLMMTAGGTYTVSVLDSLGCSAVDSFTVATGAGPVANFSTTSPSQLCPGSSAAFNNNSTGGTTFSWLNNGQLFAQTQNAAFTFSDGGTITISLVASDGLCNDTAEMVFTVFEPPLISSMITAENCPDTKDGAINLDVTGGEPPFAYAWNTGASTQDLSGLGNGTYILTIVDSESCTTTDTFHVETAGGITADFGWIQAGSVFIVFEDLSDTTATTWLWDFGDGATSTQKDPSHTYPSDGSYLVCLIVGDAFGCADTLCELVTFSVGAIAPEQFLPVKLYPNPTGGELTLDLSAISGQPVQLMLTDALGRKRMSVSTIAEAQTKLNLEAMAEGMYWVRVKAKEAEYVGRVVKR